MEFSDGQEVLVQDPANRTWNQTAIVISAHDGDSGRSYTIKFKNGKLSRRNGTFLRVFHPALPEGADRAAAQSQSQPETADGQDTASGSLPACLPTPPPVSQPIASRTWSRDNIQDVTSALRISLLGCIPPSPGQWTGLLDHHAQHGGGGGGSGLRFDQEGGQVSHLDEGNNGE